MVWSADPKQGYLTEKGIEAMRSKLTNDIFQDELLCLDKQKALSYQEVRDAAAECYEVWNKLRDELENYCKDKPRQHLSLSQQQGFEAIKNMVIQEAEHIRLGEITFENEQMDDEQDEEVLNFQNH